jgi:hypothetical protein
MLVLVSVAKHCAWLGECLAGGRPTSASEHSSGVDYKQTDSCQFTAGESINVFIASKEKGGRVFHLTREISRLGLGSDRDGKLSRLRAGLTLLGKLQRKKSRLAKKVGYY